MKIGQILDQIDEEEQNSINLTFDNRKKDDISKSFSSRHISEYDSKNDS